MKKLIVLLFLLVSCSPVTKNICAPFLDKPTILENHTLATASFIVKIQDIDEDGEADTLVVYLKKYDSEELVEYFHRDLTVEEKIKIKAYLLEKEKQNEKAK